MLIDVALLVVGLAVLVGGAEGLVRGAAGIATRIGMSAAMVGLTIVAYGTSAPELTVSMYSAVNDVADVATGNVVGSNIANVGLILGLTALARAVPCARRFARFEMPLMLGVSVLGAGLMLDGVISRLDGAIFAGAFVAYMVVSVKRDKRDMAELGRLAREELEVHGIIRERSEGEEGEGGEAELRRPWWADAAMVVAGIVMLAAGTKLFIDGAVELASAAGVSERVVGLTLVAVGTSLPELVTSIVAAVRGQQDIAVGNIIGSNIANILLILGVTATVLPLTVAPQLLRVDVLVMLAFSVALWPMMLTGGRILRREGAVLLVGYAIYMTWLYFNG